MPDFQYDIETVEYDTFASCAIRGKLDISGDQLPLDPATLAPVRNMLATPFGLSIDGKPLYIDLQENFIANIVYSGIEITFDALSISANGDVSLQKKIAYTEIDGSDDEVWSVKNSGEADWFFEIQLQDADPSNSVPIISNMYPVAFIDDGNYNEGIDSDNGKFRIRWSSEPDIETVKAFFRESPVKCYYGLKTAQSIDLGTIELPKIYDKSSVMVLSNIEDVLLLATYTPHEEQVIENGYQPASTVDDAYAPVHPLSQDWEIVDPGKWDLQEELNYTYQPEWHAVFTIQLGELVQSGVFDWKRPELDWSSAAIDAEQYERVCTYFIERFRYREISIVPFLEWAQMLKRKFVYEAMPKFTSMYKAASDGFNPLGEDEYYKRRTIDSEYPETLLSGNSDYASNGVDEEWERVKITDAAQAAERFRAFHAVDEQLLDEFESMFTSMYTSYVNGF